MNDTPGTVHPEISGQEEWLAKRKDLLTQEKDLTKHHDRIAAQRRRLPMVKIEKEYVFDGPSGKTSLHDLFQGRTQLIVYHFMFDPEWDTGCPGCTGFINALGDLSDLNERDTTFAVVSRAPLEKLLAYRQEKGWDIDWYSSLESSFNYDYHVTHDEAVAPIEYNFEGKEKLIERRGSPIKGEDHGLSVFFRIGADVYHTYSAYARGVENLTNAYSLLDVTPFGRQEDWEDSPQGWPQRPTYG